LPRPSYAHPELVEGLAMTKQGKMNILKKIFTKTIAILKLLTPVRILVAVLVGAFFWFFVLGDQGLYQLRKLVSMKTDLATRQVDLTNELEQLELEKTRLEDPKNLEMVIRKELGYIKPGEYVFQRKSK